MERRCRKRKFEVGGETGQEGRNGRKSVAEEKGRQTR